MAERAGWPLVAALILALALGLRVAGTAPAGLPDLTPALLGTLAVALVYATSARFFDPASGAVGALLAALNPLQVLYGRESVSFTLLAVLSAASVLLAAAVLTIPGGMAAGRFRRGRSFAIISAYLVISVAGLYTHPAFLFVLAAETLVFVGWLLGRPRKRHGLVTWLILLGVPLLVALPVLPGSLHEFVAGLQAGGLPPVWQLIEQVAYGPGAAGETRQGLIPLLLLAGVGLFPPFEEEEGRTLSFAERAGLVALWLLLPLAVLVLFSLPAAGPPPVRAAGNLAGVLLPAGLALAILAGRGVVMGIRLGAPVPGASTLGAVLTAALVLGMVFAGVVLPYFAGLGALY